MSTNHAMKVHDWIIENIGGLSGDREMGLLDNALEHVKKIHIIRLLKKN
ncbi:hypothetical protein KKC15_10520 [bacterium]|nr:hypothetical protein [bacterium]